MSFIKYSKDEAFKFYEPNNCVIHHTGNNFKIDINNLPNNFESLPNDSIKEEKSLLDKFFEFSEEDSDEREEDKEEGEISDDEDLNELNTDAQQNFNCNNFRYSTQTNDALINNYKINPSSLKSYGKDNLFNEFEIESNENHSSISNLSGRPVSETDSNTNLSEYVDFYKNKKIKPNYSDQQTTSNLLDHQNNLNLFDKGIKPNCSNRLTSFNPFEKFNNSPYSTQLNKKNPFSNFEKTNQFQQNQVHLNPLNQQIYSDFFIQKPTSASLFNDDQNTQTKLDFTKSIDLKKIKSPFTDIFNNLKNKSSFNRSSNGFNLEELDDLNKQPFNVHSKSFNSFSKLNNHNHDNNSFLNNFEKKSLKPFDTDHFSNSCESDSSSSLIDLIGQHDFKLNLDVLTHFNDPFNSISIAKDKTPFSHKFTTSSHLDIPTEFRSFFQN